MKIAVLGAGGVRTPLIVAAMARRQPEIGLTDLALMDVDPERLAIIRALVNGVDGQGQLPFRTLWTTDARAALSGADFVVTTFRVGGIASRVIDERVPLRYGVLGQETTGPGGFAMAMRSIPVLLEYLTVMRQECPDAWLINFANPSGLLAEAAINVGGWQRTVGICDAPVMIARAVAHLLEVPLDELFLDYFGLNHLGWLRGAWHANRDYLPTLIAMLSRAGTMPGLPFSADLIRDLGLIPNEYLYYYYYTRQAVEHILAAGRTRGEQIAELNQRLYAELDRLHRAGDIAAMREVHASYLAERGGTYMATETGRRDLRLNGAALQELAGEGYAGVALDLIAGLRGAGTRVMVLNVPNRGAIRGMRDDDVVEVPTFVCRDLLRPLAVGTVPLGPLGLMQQVKAYEKLTIAAVTEGSYVRALHALTVHPLVRDYEIARAILDDYRCEHAGTFPALK
ncbi:MAG: family 4 glycosyl hydrolase [Anaerolineae bacterium]